MRWPKKQMATGVFVLLLAAAAAADNGAGQEPSGPVENLPPPSTRFVNKRDQKLTFVRNDLGPSGLGDVDVYLTSDEGATWEQIPRRRTRVQALRPAGKDPLVCGWVSLQIPKEGVAYGYYLVVKNKAGRGNRPPEARTQPRQRIELDETPPDAKLFLPRPDPTNLGSLLMEWEAAGRNLEDRPVSLEWAVEKKGPWRAIGPARMANTGRCEWQAPADPPALAYLRLTVRDRAGNVAVAETPTPTLLDFRIPIATSGQDIRTKCGDK